MFGLMKHQGGQPAELDKDFRRMHYCGVCKAMGKSYGQTARVMLNHDTVFLAELMSAIGDAPGECGQWERAFHSINCFKLPKEVDQMPIPLRFAADVNVLLACIKVEDNRRDGSRLWGIADRWYADFGAEAREKLTGWGISIESVLAQLALQNQIEADSESVKGLPAGRFAAFAVPTATITGSIFEAAAYAMQQPLKAQQMLALGEAFGRLVFWVDAWQDFEKDERSGNFNAIRAAFGGEAKASALPFLHREANAFQSGLVKLGLSEDMVHYFVQRLEKHIPEWQAKACCTTGSCRTKAKVKVPWRMRGKMVGSLDRQWLTPGFGKRSSFLKNALGFGAAASVVLLAPSLLDTFSKLAMDFDPDWGNALNQAGDDSGFFQLRGNCNGCDNCCNGCNNCDNCCDGCNDTCETLAIAILVIVAVLGIGLVVGIVFLIRALTKPKQAPMPRPQQAAAPTTFAFREIREYPGNSMADLTEKLQAWLMEQKPFSGPEITRNDPDRKVISSSFALPFLADQHGKEVDLGTVVYELHVHVVDDKAAFIFEEFHHQAGRDVPSGGSLSQAIPSAHNQTLTAEAWATIKHLTQEKVTAFIGQFPWY